MPTCPHPDQREVDPCPAVQWIGWHLGELTGLVAPMVLAVTVWAWFAVLTVLVATVWITHEVRIRRRRRALAAARTRPAVTAPPSSRDGQASA